MLPPALRLLHEITGTALLVVGAFAAFGRKSRAARHPTVGTAYFALLTVALAAGMAGGLLAHPGRLSVFQILTPPTWIFGLAGFLIGRRRPARWRGRPWLHWHIFWQGSSYVGAISAASFQVALRFLPLTVPLTVALIALPAAAGTLLMRRAQARRLGTIPRGGVRPGRFAAMAGERDARGRSGADRQ